MKKAPLHPAEESRLGGQPVARHGEVESTDGTAIWNLFLQGILKALEPPFSILVFLVLCCEQWSLLTFGAQGCTVLLPTQSNQARSL